MKFVWPQEFQANVRQHNRTGTSAPMTDFEWKINKTCPSVIRAYICLGACSDSL